MSDYILSGCSTADLSREHFEKRDIHFACFHFYLDGKPYPDDLGQSIPFPDFYRAMENGADTKTSQINDDEYEAYFTPFLEAGKDILHLCLSSGISGAYNSAVTAQQRLQAQYPERKIYIVDSLAASSGFGLLLDTLADLRDGGMSIDSLHEWAETHKKELHHWFFSSDLTFFVKGGRVSKTAGFIGTALKICPLLNVDYMGRLIPREKVRTKKKVLTALVDKMEKHAFDGLDYSGKCYISHSDCLEDAESVKKQILSRFKKLKNVEIFDIGTTIGCHTGTGTVALFFMGSDREDA